MQSNIEISNIWMLGYCGGDKISGEASKHCFIAENGTSNCRCNFARKKNYELLYKLVLAVKKEELHMATRLRLYYINFDLNLF